MTERLRGRSARGAADASVLADSGGGCDNSGWPVLDTLLAKLGQLAADDPARRRLREYIICRCAPAARREAMRYRHAGEPIDDVVQVAMLGLILAVDRYDPRRGIPLRHFAVPTILGELRRHFRDKGWAVKVSRRMQELYQEVRNAEPVLAQLLQRSPTTADLAQHLRVSEQDVHRAREGEAVHCMRSFNWPGDGDDDLAGLSEVVGSVDKDLEAIADRDALHRAWSVLPERMRTMLTLRFVEEMSQSQIGDKLGISQMHVSRQLSRGIALLRGLMVA
ncbi:MAG TPA: sigma-70 family RNA polymerase sigma factor [Micromonosporaceae bacterium]